LTTGALVVGLGMLAGACGSSSSTNSSSNGGSTPATALPPHQKGGIIKVALAGNVDFLDPALAYYQSTWQIEYSTCVKLTNYPDLPGDAGRVIQPEAASSLPTVSPDGLTYTYTVPAGKFKFSNGTPVTVANFQYALERDLNPNQGSYFGATFLTDIKGATAYKGKPGTHVSGIKVSGDKLIITLEHKDAGIVPKLSTPFACAIPTNTPIDKQGVHTLPGAGPYYVASYTPNQSIVLKANPYYTGKRPHYASEIDYTSLTTNPSSGELEVKNGSLDYTPDALVPADYFQLNQQFGPHGTANTNGAQRFFLTPAATVTYMAMNTSRPAFSNQLVRQAVNYAINRSAIAKVAGYGVEVPTDLYLPTEIPGAQYQKNYYPLNTSDLTKAQALMAQAKAQGVKTPINAVLYTCNQPPCPDRAAVMQQELKAIGINVQIKEFDRGIQFQKEGTKGEPFDIADEGWIADYYDPYDFINILLNGEHIPATGGNNFSYFNDPTFNQKMDAANLLSGTARDRAYANIANELNSGPAPWASRAFAATVDFFGSRIGCQVDQGAYGMALNTFCIRSSG
jgi:ABC-type transport system substrate-binding protein